jgi:hypothetical protein
MNEPNTKLMTSTSNRLAPTPEFNVDWEKQFKFLNTPRTRVVMKAMTWQGIWCDLFIAKMENDIIHATIQVEDKQVCPPDVTSDPNDVESVKAAIATMLKAVWDTSICIGCKDDMSEPGCEYCETCIQYTSSGVCFEDEHDCIICIEHAKHVRKICPCGKHICLSCWSQYEQQHVCPACRQLYPNIKKRRRSGGDDSDSN